MKHRQLCEYCGRRLVAVECFGVSVCRDRSCLARLLRAVGLQLQLPLFEGGPS